MSSTEPRPESGDHANLDFSKLPPVREASSLSAEWWIAMRHLGSKKQEAFLSVVAVLSILGVMVGVATLNIVLAVMAGFEIELRDKILGTTAHMAVQRTDGHAIQDAEALADRVAKLPGVEAAAPFVQTEAMIRSRAGATGVVLKGIDPDRTAGVTNLFQDLVEDVNGSLESDAQRKALFQAMNERFDDPLAAPHEEGHDLPGILIGTQLAENLAVGPGSQVQIIDPMGGEPGPWGVPTPRLRQFRVAGVFDSGMIDYDNKWTYVSNVEAQRFVGLGDAAQAVEMRVDNPDRVGRVANAVYDELGTGYFVRTWQETNRALFEALRLEKVVMGLILFLIVAVAALLIVTTLIMTVITKGREIAILKAMGASANSIRRIFVIEGTVIGVLGTASGTVLGLLGCWFLELYGWRFDTDVYLLSHLPVVVDPALVVVVALAAVGVCFLATLYPASRAASLHPVDGLRYE